MLVDHPRLETGQEDGGGGAAEDPPEGEGGEARGVLHRARQQQQDAVRLAQPLPPVLVGQGAHEGGAQRRRAEAEDEEPADHLLAVAVVVVEGVQVWALHPVRRCEQQEYHDIGPLEPLEVFRHHRLVLHDLGLPPSIVQHPRDQSEPEYVVKVVRSQHAGTAPRRRPTASGGGLPLLQLPAPRPLTSTTTTTDGSSHKRRDRRPQVPFLSPPLPN
mmetsp:Transcript_15797/g.38945  ORF Transcript_15797/g.38945 Transcript_15797/m.38945 type:complete len:216 (+) Transcript_15797:1138-1785(+)